MISRSRAPFGGGTGVAAGCCNQPSLLDWSRRKSVECGLWSVEGGSEYGREKLEDYVYGGVVINGGFEGNGSLGFGFRGTEK